MNPSASEMLELYCIEFVEHKMASGIKYDRGASLLKKFLDFSAVYLTDDCELPKAAVLAWNSRCGNEHPKTRQQRVNTVRAFAEYLNLRGVPAYIGPKLRAGSSDFVPYVFSNDELSRLFHAIDDHPNKVRGLKDRYVMPVLFRTLYACGLRISEAVRLRICDVDLDDGVVAIIATKFHKDRLVPVNEVFLARLREYAGQFLTLRDKDAPFFPTSRGGHYSTHTIYAAFRKFLWDAGISHGGKGRGPRLHDIRHTFAVHCLRKWVRAGDDLTAAVPYLAAYMGHSRFYHTQVYLHLTADMYPDIVAKTEKMFNIFPEWEGCYETD
jgi:integrase